MPKSWPIFYLIPSMLPRSTNVSIRSIYQTASTNARNVWKWKELKGARLSRLTRWPGEHFSAAARVYTFSYGWGSKVFGKHQYTEHEIPRMEERESRETSETDTEKDKRGVVGEKKEKDEGVSCQPPFIMADVGSDSHIVPPYTWIDRFLSSLTNVERIHAFAIRSFGNRSKGHKSKILFFFWTVLLNVLSYFYWNDRWIRFEFYDACERIGELRYRKGGRNDLNYTGCLYIIYILVFLARSTGKSAPV